MCVKAGAALTSYFPNMKEQPLIDSQNEKVLSLTAETQFAPNGIVSWTGLRTPTSRVILFGFAEGQELSEHTSTQHGNTCGCGTRMGCGKPSEISGDNTPLSWAFP